MIGRHLVCDECNDYSHDAYFDQIGRPKLAGSVDYPGLIETGEVQRVDIFGTGWVAEFYQDPDDGLAIMSDHYCSDCR